MPPLLAYILALEQEDLGKIALRKFELQPHHITGLWIILGLAIAAAIFNLIFGKRIRKATQDEEPLVGEPLEYEKIVVDENNARQGVRVEAVYDLMFEGSRLPDGKKGPSPKNARSVDISMKGMGFVSDAEFPLKTDVLLRLMESPVAASPVLTGTVVLCRPWHEKEGHWLTGLNLKNISPEASQVLHRIVTQGERELLAKEREKEAEEEKKKDPEASENPPSKEPE